MGGIGGEEQLHVALLGAAYCQNHLVPAGLINFIYLSSGDSLIQFVDQTGETKRVQRHWISPHSMQAMAAWNSSLSRSVRP